VKLGLDLGLPHVAETLQRLGLESAPVLNPSLLLGTVEMTPLEVVEIYTSLGTRLSCPPARGARRAGRTGPAAQELSRCRSRRLRRRPPCTNSIEC